MTRLRGRAGARRGGAIVEFALVMPLLLGLLLGSFDLVALLRARLRLAQAASMVADLAGRTPAMTAALLADRCVGAGLAMAPFAASGIALTAGMALTVAGVTVFSWQLTGCGATLALPAVSLLPVSSAAGGLVVVKVSYTLTVGLKFLFPSGITLTETAFAVPRNATSVLLN